MGDGHLRALLVIAATTLAVGCGGATPQPPAHHGSPATARGSPATARGSPAPAPVKLTRTQACRELRGDLARNQGVPDIPALRRIADHVTAPRMAAEARTAVKDIDHTGVAPIALALLRDDCARAGVQIPAR